MEIEQDVVSASGLRSKLFYLAAGLLFFFLPAVLVTAGVRAKPIENRPLTPAPSWRLSWKVGDEINAYINDRVPFRASAIRANNKISLDLFGEAPSTTAASGNNIIAPGAAAGGNAGTATNGGTIAAPAGSSRVLVGKDGWLYLASDAASACERPNGPPQWVLDNLARLDQVLTKAGKTFVFAVAPDKSSMVPEFLPGAYQNKSCAPEGHLRTREVLAQQHNPAYIDMFNVLDEAQKAAAKPLYYRTDTHWDDAGSSAFARQVVQRVAPKLLADVTMTSREVDRLGDLTALFGDNTKEHLVQDDIMRPGVTVGPPTQVVLPGGSSATQLKTTSTQAPLDKRKVLLVGDSFAITSQHALAPFFENLSLIQTSSFLLGTQQAVKDVSQANVVVLLWVERSLQNNDKGLMWTTDFIDALAKQLGQH